MANRRQHTIPQFYLRPFLGPGWVYRRGADKPRPTKSPVDVAVQQDYYGKTGAAHKTLDDVNSWSETQGAPVFKKLIEEPHAFTKEAWEVLSYLLANLYVRTPAVVEEMQASQLEIHSQVIAKVKERIATSKEDILELVAAELVLAAAELNKASLGSKGGYRFAASTMFRALKPVAKCIQQMKLRVYEAPPGLL